ncbi:MAG: hypothetical protein J5892_05590 [Bacilli bacterium]|nr:hypothetical protein [Bacilli bacterium]
MEKDEKIMVKCDYCGVLNDLNDGTCKYCGGVLHYDNSAELLKKFAQDVDNLTEDQLKKLQEALSKLNDNNKATTEADLKKGALMSKKLEGTFVITFKSGKRDIAIRNGKRTFTSIISGIKYFDAAYQNSVSESILFEYQGFNITNKESINEYMTAEEIEKKLTETLTGKDVALIIYRAVNNLPPAKDYSVQQLKHTPNNTKRN